MAFILIIYFLILIFIICIIICKPKDRELSKSINLVLNNYQVQVYNSWDKMIHCDLYKGFSPEEVIMNCRNAIQIDLNYKTTPIKFHTIIN